MTSHVPFSFFTHAFSFVSNLKMHRDARDLFLYFVFLGVCLEGLYLALFSLLAGNDSAHDPLFQAWHAFLPWLPLSSWIGWLHLPWFDPGTSAGNANSLLVVLCLALCGVLLAAQIGRRRPHISPHSQRACAWLILAFTALFALTLLLSPPHLDIFSRDMLLSWSSGHIVIFHHFNPYIMTPTAYPQDRATTLLTTLLTQLPPNTLSLSSSPVGTTGPLGIDIGILASLFGQDHLARTLLGFRVVGLLFHLGNALFIWLIVRRSKPEMSLPSLVLYAWNPLFLLLGVAQMHQELVSIFFVLLAIYFLQRDAHVLSWFFLSLAVLTNLFCLLLLPLFLCTILRKTRFLVFDERLFLWLALLALSLVVFVLAYLPYWDGWAWNGLVTNISLLFFPPHPLNSLDASLLTLPFSKTILNFFNPVYWSAVLLGFLGLFLLLSFWLADTVDLLLLCAGWLLLIFFIFQPIYWPWYMFLPLALILCSAHGKTLMLAFFLLIGALVSYYCWSRGLYWQGQGLLVLGLPCLMWGWYMFLISTWKMTQRKAVELAEAREWTAQRPRSPWLSRPSWPSRPGKMR
jgi:hypothetical protein